MSKPIAIAKGIAFAFPDVCKTPVPNSSPVPLPYPNIVQLDGVKKGGKTDEDGKELLIGPGGDHALLKGAVISSSSGDEAGVIGGVKSGKTKEMCEIVQASESVVYGPDAIGLVRFMDQTEQNDGNAQGMVLSAHPMVLVGD